MPKHTVKNSFYETFVEELRDIYNAESQIIQFFPKVIDAASTKELRDALQKHYEETKSQKKRLEQIFTKIKENAEGVTCDGMRGLIAESQKALRKDLPDIVRDALLIADLQKIEHYEIATYGSLKTFAKHLELNEINNLLQEILNEESNANEKLTKVAEGGFFTSGINVEAAAR